MKCKHLIYFNLAFIIITQYSCAVAFEALEGVEAEAAEAAGAVAEGGIVSSEISGLSAIEVDELATEGILADDITLFRSSAMEVRAGRLMTSEEVAFNNELGKITIARNVGRNPQLFVRGYNKPFAEVIPEEGSVKIYSINRIFPIENRIFSVEGERVNIMEDPLNGSYNVMGIVHKGDLVVKLSENGNWYRVNILNNGQKISGFIESGLLVPLVIGSLRHIYDSTQTAYDVLRTESSNRLFRDHRVMTPDEGMSLLYDEFGYRKSARKISFNPEEWDSSVNHFFKVNYDNLTILNYNSFGPRDLEILGFTKAGELLKFIKFETIGVVIRNPLDFRPDNSGEWVQIKTLDGKAGWIILKPFGENYSNGSIFSRPSKLIETLNNHPPTQPEDTNFPLYIKIIIGFGVVFLGLLIIGIINRSN